VIRHRATVLAVSAFLCMCYAVGYVVTAVTLQACASQPATREAQLAAITAGCDVSLALERDAGVPADLAATQRGCEAALRTLDPVKPDGGEAGAK
jgi:hypothetical protein